MHADHKYSFRSCDDAGSLFKSVFPDSKIVTTLKMVRTKEAYCVVHGLAPEFLQQLVNDVNDSDSDFALHYDETTTD